MIACSHALNTKIGGDSTRKSRISPNSIKWISGIFLVFLFLSFSQKTVAQCFYDGPFHIADLSSNNIVLNIEGATSDSLSNPDQGVCGVNLHFTHETIGDLLIILRSPSGDEVFLVGPTTAPPPFTDFAVWDISFLPCGVPPNPDPGFNGQWSNAQSWGVFGNYSGSYHPFSGCLEDFDSGPVNGSWTLFIQDGIGQDEGELIGFSIIFCNPDGIDCETCLPDGGILNAPRIEICQGEVLESIPDPIYQTGEGPSEDDYFYKYLLTKGDSILAILPDSNYIFEESDTFRLYGLSLLKSDSMVLDQLAEDYTISELISALSVSPGDFCGDVAINWLNLIVHPSYNHSLDSTLCFNEGFAIGDTILYEAGLHSVVLNSVHGCDSLVTIDLSIDSSVVANAMALDTFSCHVDSVLLVGATGDLPVDALWYWSDGEGGVLGDSGVSSLIVFEPGEYFFITRNEDCRDTAIVNVVEASEFLPIELYGGTIGCLGDSTEVGIFSFENIIEFSWTGPEEFETGDSSFFVTEPGVYNLNAIDLDSCVREYSILIEEDLRGPEIHTDTIWGVCEGDVVELVPDPFDSSWEVFWVYSGDTLTGSPPEVDFGGVFELVITDSLGCTGINEVVVAYIHPTPVLAIASAPLGCNEAWVPIIASTGLGGSQYYWEGPEGFEGFLQTIQAPLPGDYYITATTPAGCVVDSVFTVESEGNLPEWELYLSDSLGCIHNQLQILVEVSFTNVEFEWTGPGGFSSEETAPFITESGQYFLEMVTQGGCVISDSIYVEDNFEVGDIEIFSDTLSCSDPEGFLWVEGSSDYHYFWSTETTDPVEGDSIIFDRIETFTLQVSDSNNLCSAFFDHLPFGDFSLPGATWTADTLDCLNEQALILLEGGSFVDFWIEDLTGVISVSDTGFIVENAGDYTLFLQAGNGCIDSLLIEVVEDSIPPSFAVIGSHITCDSDSAVLYFETEDNYTSFHWWGPNNFSSDDSVIVINTPGEYFLELTGANGCVETREFTVRDDSESLEIEIQSEGDLNCDRTEVRIFMVNPGNDFSFEWTGPGNFSENMDTVMAVDPGWYYLMVENNDGCLGMDSILISEDLVPPDISLEYSDLNCSNTTVEARVDSDAAESYSWQGPEGFVSDFPIIQIDLPGTYFLELTGQNGCVLDTLIQIAADTVKPIVDIEGEGELNCRNASLFLQPSTPQSGVEFYWILPGGEIDPGNGIEVDEEGGYYLIGEAENGCTDMDSIQVSENFELPEGSIVQGEYICESGTVDLHVENHMGVDSVRWYSPDGSVNTGFELTITVEGIYTVELMGENGCVRTLEVEPDFSAILPDFELTYDAISCETPYAQIEIVTDVENELIILGPGGFESDSAAFLTNVPGGYTVYVTAPNGCADSLGFTVEADTSLPVAEIQLLGLSECEENRVELMALIEGEIENYSLNWSTSDGEILDQISAQNVIVGTVGTYVLRVLNTDNGCETLVTYVLEEISQPLGGVEINVVQADCFDRDWGEVEVVDVGGNYNPPLEFSLDGEVWQNNPVFDRLSPGSYSMWVRDAQSCVDSVSFIIEELPRPEVDLGGDRKIEAGQSLRINPEVFPQGVTYEFYWPDWVDCENCPEIDISPASSTVLYVSVVDPLTGCEAYDEIFIEVTTSPLFYVPNVFYPGSSVGNDVFRIYSNSPFIESVSVNIFDRWGERIFSLEGCRNVEACYWDGTARGEPLNPGVFIYDIVVKTTTDEEFRQSGEFQLIR